MHAVQHFGDCVYDYGPAHSWSCYAFERMNGCMGATNTNMHNVEESFLKAWCQQDYLRVLPHLTGHWARFNEKLRALFTLMHGSNDEAERDALSPHGLTDHEKLMQRRRHDVGLQLALVERSDDGDHGEHKDEHAHGSDAGAAPAAAAGAGAHAGAVARGDAAALEPWMTLPDTRVRREKKSKPLFTELQAVARTLLDDGAVDVVLHEYRTGKKLVWHGHELGTRYSRRHRHSWLMVRTGSHTRPARALLFALLCITSTSNGIATTSNHLLVKLWYGYLSLLQFFSSRLSFLLAVGFSAPSVLLLLVFHVACPDEHRFRAAVW